MTDEQIVHAREEMRKAITDPKHPWHKGALLLGDVAGLDDRARAFLQRIGPYCFEEDGSVLTAREGS